MKIALDAMGGDYAPAEVIKGGLVAAQEDGVYIAFVGPEERLRAELPSDNPVASQVNFVNATEVVTMQDSPVTAFKQKRDSTIVVGMELVKSGQADAFVSAGNTGAIVTTALLVLGRKKGIARPALSAMFPFPSGPLLFLDLGANCECKPSFLVQFARMGSIYMRKVFDIEWPRVGLLSNGEEENKGNKLVQDTHKQLKKGRLNFIGNVEGKDIARGVADVIVTDGFTGNVLLKMGEGLGEMMLEVLKRGLSAQSDLQAAAGLLQPVVRSIISIMDYTEYGGALLLGVDGNVVVAHGRSDAKAIRNAILAAGRAVEHEVVQALG
ncbi:phosphate acyltransferase PlsX [Chloroflexota bacterium]